MLEVERIGPQHQAGSDSLLTGRAFFKMTEIYFEDDLDDTKVSSLFLILTSDNSCFSIWATCTGLVPTMRVTPPVQSQQPRQMPSDSHALQQVLCSVHTCPVFSFVRFN